MNAVLFINILYTFPHDYTTLCACIKSVFVFYLTCSAHERKCISRGEAVAPANQSKLSRVSSGFGLSKLTGARRNKKESGMNKNNLSAQVLKMLTSQTVGF